jgi:phosphoribosylanthranilate isomerase
MTLVKICGNRTPEDVLAAADCGADLVGMVFAESRRRVDVSEAQAMVRALGPRLDEHEMVVPPPVQPHVREQVDEWFRHGAQVIEQHLQVKRPLTVGVFADQPIEEVNEIALEAGVDLVQLSGDESWEDCLLVARPVVQVVHVSPLDSPSDPLEQVEPGFALVLMLDSAHGPYRGGSGRTFDWEVAQGMARRVPLMLAGGLDPANVGEAIARVRPWAVDVSTGTETGGVKDHRLVRAFIEAVRAAGTAVSAPRVALDETVGI